jgi:hypothetical protein
VRTLRPSSQNAKGAPLSAPSFTIAFFFTLYIQNSILQQVKGTFLRIYFPRVVNGLTRFSPRLTLDKIFLRLRRARPSSPASSFSL